MAEEVSGENEPEAPNATLAINLIGAQASKLSGTSTTKRKYVDSFSDDFKGSNPCPSPKVAKVKSESSEDFDNARESYSEVTTKEITANLVFKNENRENTTIVGQNGNHQGSENEEDNMEDVSQYLKVEIDDDKQEAEIVIDNSEEEIVCEPQLECGEENAEGLEEGNGGDEMFTDDLSLLSTVICNLCGVTLLTGEVSRHFKRQHPEASRAETTKQRTMWHWCKLCGKVLKFTNSAIDSHLRSSHGSTSLFSYQSQFLKNSGIVLCDDLSDLCQFRCGLCGMICELKGDHSRHHPGVTAQYEYARKTHHRCKICSVVLLFSRPNIMDHVRKYHGTSWAHYKLTYLTGSRDNKRLFREPRGGVGGSKRLSQSSSQQDGQPAEEEKVFTDDLHLISTVACDICGKVMPMTHQVRRHFQTEHPTEDRRITPQRTSWHECKLCEERKVLNFSSECISNHLRRFHKSTSWSSYSAQYLQNTNPFESQRRKPVPSSKSSEPAIFLSEGEPEIKEEIKIEPFNENNSQAPHVINDSLEEAEVKREICDEENGSEYLENNDPLESPPPHLKPSSSIASRPHSNPVIHKTNLEA